MTIEEAHGILSNGLANAPSEHEWCVAFKMAIDTMRKYQQLKAELMCLKRTVRKFRQVQMRLSHGKARGKE